MKVSEMTLDDLQPLLDSHGADPAQWPAALRVAALGLIAADATARADLLRGEVAARRQALEDAQHQFFTAREQIHTALRRDPFSADDMRAAMLKTRTARQNFDQTLQGIFANAATRMSNSGRNALADWPPRRKSASKDK